MEIFQYSFMINAFLAGIMIATLTSVLGTFIVVRRYSMLSDALAHIALLGVACGILFEISTSWSTIVIVLFLSWVIELIRSTHKVYADALLAIFLSGALSLSLVIVSVAHSFNSSLFNYLFGSIVAITTEDLYLMAAVTVLFLALTATYFNKFVFIAYDEDVAKVSGVNTKLFNTLFIAMVAITIGVSIKIIGALLISALITIPVSTAINFKVGFKKTMLLSLLFSLISVISGLLISFYAALPSGATIVLAALILFILSLIKSILQKS